jgi:hypothetical protein
VSTCGVTRTRSARWRDQDGIALVVALMALLLLTALGLSLALTTSTETTIAGNFATEREALYAADAGLERAVQALLTAGDWNAVLSGTTPAPFSDGSPGGDRALPGGGTLTLGQVLNMANCGKPTTCSPADMDVVTGDRPWGPHNPRWQLYAYGDMNRLLPTGTINSPFYIVVMAADDPADPDTDPARDANGILLLRADAFGPGNSHKTIVATVARTEAPALERGYTGQRGEDEQGRASRTAPVQTPGKTLSAGEFSIATGGKMVM